jgi:hypothetical protein
VTGRFLTAEWRQIVMMNFAVDPGALARYVPQGIEVDFHDGAALVSLVGFLFLRTKIMGIPVPYHCNFEEVNLRLYVRRKAQEGWRRGVVFIKEIVPRRAVAWVANRVYGENYVALPMEHHLESERVQYRWRHRGQWCSMTIEAGAEAKLPAAGSEEEFVSEHYWGYTALPGGGTLEYQVEHPRWPLRDAIRCSLAGDMSGLYDPALAASLGSRPRSAFLAEGSAVTVRKGVRL